MSILQLFTVILGGTNYGEPDRVIILETNHLRDNYLASETSRHITQWYFGEYDISYIMVYE